MSPLTIGEAELIGLFREAAASKCFEFRVGGTETWYGIHADDVLAEALTRGILGHLVDRLRCGQQDLVTISNVEPELNFRVA
ncbi:hypothetical protein H7J08_00865 [Mycobacterium frederiksbergense]|uniref:hypothetical protein n=1 Tax=Mycolicibacterium frederiksbergense TaxID=117567 RepID=UPI0021F2FCDB|nr:hypothetical protein [Mycolicibacterium frederiksbergense]MCV7043228.1 hypothetical protein [Mycolicibacterium frederiksbergense]